MEDTYMPVRAQEDLGLGNFFMRFIIGYSSLTAPLTDLTSEKVSLSPSSWTKIHEDVLEGLKKRLTTAPLLLLLDSEGPSARRAYSLLPFQY